MGQLAKYPLVFKGCPYLSFHKTCSIAPDCVALSQGGEVVNQGLLLDLILLPSNPQFSEPLLVFYNHFRISALIIVLHKTFTKTIFHFRNFLLLGALVA